MRILIYIVMALCSLLPFTVAGAASLPDGIIVLKKTPAPDFTISDADGNRYSLQQSRGKWVFLHFWASWCGPCRYEIPSIAKLQKKMAGKPIDIVLIDVAEDEDAIFTFLGSVAPSLHSYMDRNGELARQWVPRGLPTTFFIDPQGNRRYLAFSGQPWDQPAYLEFINGLLREK
jgi:thiol-disulfide isomerase/thioredoxin